MPRTENFSELRDEARRDPKRACRIDKSFFALGSSKGGRSAADADEILAEGFGQD